MSTYTKSSATDGSPPPLNPGRAVMRTLRSRPRTGMRANPAHAPKPARRNALRVLWSGKQACKPSSVLPCCRRHHTGHAGWQRMPRTNGVTTIYLGRLLPAGSSDLPERVAGHHMCAPIRSCSGWGLPSQPVSRLLVRSYRTVAPLPVRPKPPSAVCISVALSLGLLPPDVIRHPALWSSDFPLVRPFGTAPAVVRLTPR